MSRREDRVLQHCRTSNIQRPTSNTEVQTRMGSGGFFPTPGGPDARDENPDEFVGFIDQRRDPLRWQKWHSLDQTEPTIGFAQFLKTNLELMDEIVRRFSGLCFAVVRQWRGAGAQ